MQGTQIGDNGTDGERFIDNKRIEGTIPEMLEDAIRFVQKNTRTKTIIDPITAKRTDKPTLEQFCKTPRSRKEITEFLGIRSATYAINKYVIPLIEQGKLFMDIPDKPTSRNQRFYSK